MTREELENFLMETLVLPIESERDASEQKLAEKERELEEERKAKKKAQKENEALKKALEDERNKNNN